MISIDLTGRTAIVTGAANGIGLASARALDEAGARVVGLDLHDRDDFPGELVVGDVTVPATCAELVDRVPPGSPSVLINNAALQLERRLGATSEEDVRRVFDVNVLAAIRLTRLFAQRAGVGSSVVNLASILGLTGDPELGAYTVSKGAVVNLTRTVALEYAGQLRVNAVCPGAIRTPLTTRVWDVSDDPEQAEAEMTRLYPVGRIGEPEDVAMVVAFLASDLASFVNGTMVTVDGGLLAANAEWALGRR